MSYHDGPPTVAELTGLEAVAAAAAEMAYDDDLALADRREDDAAAHLRSQLIAQGRIRPASKGDATRAMLVAKGLILPADPAEVEQARKPRLAKVTLAAGYDAMIRAGTH